MKILPGLFVLLSSLVFAVPVAGEISAAQPQSVMSGIDVLVRDGFRQLEGRRVGLITNQTGLDGKGLTTASRLHEAPAVRLVTLFSPEHGLHGMLDVPVIGDGQDEATGVRVYSLYGETRKPLAPMLEGIDTLVFDIQDIGTRFYTYISTLGLAMQSAADAGVRFVVLDRPNPINGVAVDGPLTDEGRESFTAFHSLPVRHGMTVGELALMFRGELGLELDLEVIQLENWTRSSYFDATGLRWVNPSPNMRSLAQALLYPGIGLLETTNLSVGRGTDTPFELVGAPWLDGGALALEMNRAGLPGVRFIPVEFIPVTSKFQGERCGGVNILVVDRAVFEPVRTGLEMARQLWRLYPATWDIEAFDRLLVSKTTLDALRAGQDIPSIQAAYRDGLDEFARRRADFLLYD
ncbi:MAG: DUF1343 domain-containing protein [Xanthomonadales bacterium]|nr:DUF1343 domain-containing protein [Xanthomonadales bacterium]